MAGPFRLKKADFQTTRFSDDLRPTSKGRPPESTPLKVRGKRLQGVLSLLASGPHSVRELAEHAHLSQSHLRHLFKQETGVTLNNVVQARRLEQAAEFLTTTSMNTKEIGYLVGFESRASFTRAFRRRFGQSPDGYRQLHVGRRPTPRTPENPDKLKAEGSPKGERPKIEAIDEAIAINLLQQKLGLQKRLVDETDLVSVIEAGLPLTAISSLMDHGIYEKEIYSLVIPRRTLQHRRSRKEKLSVEESDRAARIARLTTLAERVFADPEAAMRWLRSPKRRFTGRTPMEMLATEAGSRLIEEMLYQLDEGMAA